MTNEILEATLDTKQCADIALYMYHNWQEEMKPPIYKYIKFEDWLYNLLEEEE